MDYIGKIFALKKTRASGRNIGKVFNPVVKLVLENQPFLMPEPAEKTTLFWIPATQMAINVTMTVTRKLVIPLLGGFQYSMRCGDTALSIPCCVVLCFSISGEGPLSAMVAPPWELEDDGNEDRSVESEMQRKKRNGSVMG